MKKKLEEYLQLYKEWYNISFKDRPPINDVKILTNHPRKTNLYIIRIFIDDLLIIQQQTHCELELTPKYCMDFMYKRIMKMITMGGIASIHSTTIQLKKDRENRRPQLNVFPNKPPQYV